MSGTTDGKDSDSAAMDTGSTETNTEDQSSSTDKANFHVDKHLIPTASLDEQASKELEGLDLDVFNQDDFEQGVLAQVDKALEIEEKERKKNALKKEMKAILDDIKTVKHELANLSTQLARMGHGNFSGGANRRVESAKRQKLNKQNQLKALEARKKLVQARIDGKAPLEDDTCSSSQNKETYGGVLGLGSSAEELDREKKIRLGQMTPFGTVVTPDGATAGSSQASDDVPSEKQNKDSSSSQVHTGPSDSSRTENDAYCDEHKSGVERAAVHELSESSDGGQDGDEWLPSDQDQGSDADDDKDLKPDKKRLDKEIKGRHRKKRKKVWPPPAVSRPIYHSSGSENEETEDTNSSVKIAPRDPSVRKVRDDGNTDYYESRMSDFQAEERQKQILRERGVLSESEDDEEFDDKLKVPGRIWSKLYKYQKTCVKWLWELHCQEAGGIIGDEMGLGKTIQMISFLAALKYSKLRNRNFSHIGLGPVIVVCPATVMHQWVKEFHKWWPLFRVAILHSSGSYSGKDSVLVREIVRNNGVLVTSYTTLVLQQEHILPYDWHYVVLDEGHKIRNPDVQATLCCKQFRTPHRVILSGSPIQNNLKELWSLMDFVFPGRLGTLPDFLQHFAVPILQGGYSSASPTQVQTAYKCACVLRDTINPYLLRRMKADVKANLNLPGKSEQVLFCRLTDEQREVYQEYLDSRECQAILRGRFQIFAGLITLRKICNHPDLSTGGPRIFKGQSTDGDESLEYGYWRRSGKMIVVEALLRLWKKQGQRVLLFSQSTQMLNILESFVQDRKYSYIRMDGSTSISARQPLVQRYNSDKSIYVFLLTTRVGGLGINLVGANRIIIFDPDWNPSTDTQARERAWRIGQEKQVTIYRLLTTGTIEEKIYHRQIFKQFLTNRVLKDPKQRRLFKSNDMYELFTLGVSDDKGETETAAIFAGTGSDVKVKLKKVNRFDQISEEKKAAVEEVKKEAEEKDLTQNFEEDEIQRMRELARKLSQKMEKAKQKKSEKTESGSSKIAETKVSSVSASGSCEKKTEDRKTVKAERSRSDSTRQEVRNGSSSKRKREDGERKEKHRKKHKKRKHKDRSFEGERIPHLDKFKDLKGQVSEEQERQHAQSEEMDNYVLHNLFKKTGIQGALKHDTIMEPGQSDYVIVESEADKVAKAASAALKKSRSLCPGAMTGVPSWTGSHGAQKKPRFGLKKNTQLTGPEKAVKPRSPERKPDTKIEEPAIVKDSHFDGSQAGSVQTDTRTGTASADLVSSNDLLNKMRTRNQVFTTAPAADDDDEEEGQESEDFVPDQDALKLIQTMRDFILFECQNIGQASTKELLDEFGPKLPPKNSAKFRAMLHSICDFEKVDGHGVWKLRRDFR